MSYQMSNIWDVNKFEWNIWNNDLNILKDMINVTRSNEIKREYFKMSLLLQNIKSTNKSKKIIYTIQLIYECNSNLYLLQYFKESEYQTLNYINKYVIKCTNNANLKRNFFWKYQSFNLKFALKNIRFN